MGIGNQMDDGHPVPWTVGQMETAFEDISRPVSAKSLENWRAGNSRPLPRNLVSLADIVSGGDVRLRDQWLEALSSAARDKEPLGKMAEPKHRAPEINEDKSETILSPKFSKMAILGGAIAAICLAGLAWLAGTQWAKRSQTPSVVTDMRFCTEPQFNFETKRCLIDEPVIPAKTKIIYVSFEADPPYGTPFERRWYRDGRQFIERDGFFDEAWENWTWINQDDGLLPGDYVLRVIIDGRTTTHGFTLTPETTASSIAK